MLIDHLRQLMERGSLSADEAYQATSAIMAGTEDPAIIGSYLTALRLRGETPDELAGTARAMRDHAVRPTITRTGWADTCGTGGSPVSTFNISTAAAIVASACGVPIAKHGNRSFSSSTGSADVLTVLGVDVQATAEIVSRALDSIGLAFLFAPLWHPAMKHAGPVRQALRFRTIFNMVGPLANPVPLDAQIVGVGRQELLRPMAGALANLGVPRAAVVWGEDGTDEVSLAGPTRVIHVVDGRQTELRWTPADFGLPSISPDVLAVQSPEESAAIVRAVLDGVAGPAADVVHANVAALVWLVGKASDLKSGVAISREAIQSGRAKRQLEQLVAMTRGQ